MSDFDVIIVGAGNAAMAAAVSAHENGAKRVIVLEKAPEHFRGGNTYFSGGLLRFAFDSRNDLRPLLPDAERQVPGFFEEITSYTAQQFWEDLQRLTHRQIDLHLSMLLVNHSYDTVRWLVNQGIAMELAVSLSAICHKNKVGWSPGALVQVRDGGVGLSRMWFNIAAERGIEVLYQTAAVSLTRDNRSRVTGVLARSPKGYSQLTAKAIILACGGFESNAAWRAHYLGRQWAQARVRGTAYNTGDGLRMAFDLNALRYGNFTHCHSTPIDAGTSFFGSRSLTDKSNRLSYPFGVMLNRLGQRFCDEGEDFQFFTYAKMGRIILSQPNGIAYQIFDANAVPLLEKRYKTGKPILADSLGSLVKMLPINQARACEVLKQYNGAQRQGEFDPTQLDGLTAAGIQPPKSNWARRLEDPPFFAYPVTGGITFTYGGVKINEMAQVLDSNQKPISGLFACGEMVGGLFNHNYLAGTGLLSGAFFGRMAGASAAAVGHKNFVLNDSNRFSNHI